MATREWQRQPLKLAHPISIFILFQLCTSKFPSVLPAIPRKYTEGKMQSTLNYLGANLCST